MNDSYIKDTERNGIKKLDQERRKAHRKSKKTTVMQTSNSLLAKTLL